MKRGHGVTGIGIVGVLLILQGCAMPIVENRAGETTAGPVAAEATPEASGDDTKKSDAKPDDKESAAKKAEEKAEKLAKKKRELQYAEADERIAELVMAAEVESEENTIRNAQRSLEEANRALANFNEVQKPTKLERSRLGVDRSVWSMEAQKQELQELEVMYQEEEIATLTKELVLQRGRMRLSFAERDLKMRRQEAEALTSYELPKQQQDLEHKVRQAELALRKAEGKRREQTLRRDLKRLKSKHSREDLEKEIEKLEKKASEEEEADE